MRRFLVFASLSLLLRLPSACAVGHVPSLRGGGGLSTANEIKEMGGKQLNGLPYTGPGSKNEEDMVAVKVQEKDGGDNKLLGLDGGIGIFDDRVSDWPERSKNEEGVVAVKVQEKDGGDNKLFGNDGGIGIFDDRVSDWSELENPYTGPGSGSKMEEGVVEVSGEKEEKKDGLLASPKDLIASNSSGHHVL